MPTLKQINCTVEWENSKVPFREYGLKYGDGIVDCFLAIPETPVAFSIHTKSKGYIAPGLAMFVYMDGIYQCNRNRFNLQLPSRETPKKLGEVDFRVRQKEETRADGGWVGRSWRFEKLRIVNAASENEPPKEDFDDLGTIQVIVLRCQSLESGIPTALTKSLATTPANSPTSVSGARSGWGSKNNTNADIFALDGSVDKPAPFALDGPGDWGGGPSWASGHHGQNQGAYGSQGSGQWGGQQSSQGWNGPGPQGKYNTPAGSVANFSHHGPGGRGPQNTPHGSDDGVGGGQGPSGYGASQHGGQNSPTNWGDPNGGNPQGTWGSGSNHSGSQPRDWNNNAGNRSNQQHNWSQNGGGNWNNQQNSGGGGGRSGGNGKSTSNWGGSDAGKNNNNSGPNRQGNSWGGSNSGNDNGRPQSVSWGGGGGGNQDSSGDWNRNNNNHGNSGPWNSGNGNSNQGNSAHWNGGNDNSNQGNSDDWSGNDNSKNQGNSGWGVGNRSGGQSGKNGDDWEGNNNNEDQNDSSSDQNNDNTGGKKERWGNDNNFGNDTSGGNDWSGDNTNSGNQDSGWNNDNQNSGFNVGNNDNQNSGSNNWGNNDNAQGPASNNGNQNTTRPPSEPPSIVGSRRSSRAAWVTPISVAQQGDEPPMYTVPEQVAEELKTSHQVQPGQSAPYIHKMSRPSYMDTMRQPYARFIFRYRTKEAIEQELGITIERDRDEEKRRLATLSKEKIIEILLGAQDGHHSQTCTPRSRTPRPETYITPKNVFSFNNARAVSKPPSAAQSDPAPKSPTLGPASRKASTSSSTPLADPIKSPTPAPRSRKTSTTSTKPPTDKNTTATAPETDKSTPDNDKNLPEPTSANPRPSGPSPTIANQPLPSESTPSVRPKSSHGSMASGALDINTLTSKLQDLKTKDEQEESVSRSRENSAVSTSNFSVKEGRGRKVSMPGAWDKDEGEVTGGSGNPWVW